MLHNEYRYYHYQPLMSWCLTGFDCKALWRRWTQASWKVYNIPQPIRTCNLIAHNETNAVDTSLFFSLLLVEMLVKECNQRFAYPWEDIRLFIALSAKQLGSGNEGGRSKRTCIWSFDIGSSISLIPVFRNASIGRSVYKTLTFQLQHRCLDHKL